MMSSICEYVTLPVSSSDMGGLRIAPGMRDKPALLLPAVSCATRHQCDSVIQHQGAAQGADALCRHSGNAILLILLFF